ncbi:MAG TPA: indolepyruvate ferredoxin oxidoreductase subunit alpha [Candidatus Korarchaeota archaeon]|nr:indolepyruvate ferredoxin oxidoreductase subunit alpha [Candidatus Korarchaeota archaeon]
MGDLLAPANTLEVLLGNEAIARGALEAGLNVAAAYPGTPSTEIGEALSRVANKVGIYFEWSANEKVAAEVAMGAAWSGLRSLTMMKHVGFNVASDAIFTLTYAGVTGAMVIVSADDPHAHSSQNEQDNRHYSEAAGLPMLEPSNPQEAKDFTKEAFKISDRFKIPVLVRTTTRISHQRAPVELGEITAGPGKGEFIPPEPDRYLQVGAIARKHHAELLRKLKEIQMDLAPSYSRLEGPPDAEFGVITSGVSYAHAKEALKLVNVDAKILKLGMTYPLPEKVIGEFLSSINTVLVVEELDPYLEQRIKAIAKDYAPDVEILGKMTGHMPRVGEYTMRTVLEGLSKAIGVAPPVDFAEIDRRSSKVLERVPPRPPILCPACPHRSTGYALRRAAGSAAFMGDIGCYALLFQKPFRVEHVTHAMGSSIGLANGIDIATDKDVVALIGDSTFFHAGIPALINAVHNKRKMVVMIMDNRTTAMTGHQPHPGTEVNAMGEQAPAIDIERIVRGIGVDYVQVIDPYDHAGTEKAIREALKRDGVSVIITRRECALLTVGRLRREGKKIVPYRVNPEKCTYCRVCINTFACPAFVDTGSSIEIDPAVCFGCGACVPVCPYGAFEPQEGSLNWREQKIGV